MQELSPTFLTTFFTTAIAVAMAAFFFCCWGKRNSYDAAGDASVKSSKNNEQNSSNTTSSGEGTAGEKISSTKSPQKLDENGVSSEIKSSVGIVVDGSDLGDFSAVSREQEILRSYRKPPPPKNRARQSRAPRAAFKSSAENLDIFTELTEENSNFSLTVPGEINGDTASEDTTELDSCQLRPRSADSDISSGFKREDVRSSMLADIEQTLAALHLKAEEASEDNSKDSVANDNGEDACIQAKATPVSSRPSSRLTEGVSEHDVSSARPSSGNQSPLTKPKIGPKVSPKPAIKKRFLNPQPPSTEETKPQGEIQESDDTALKTNALSFNSQPGGLAQVTKTLTHGQEVETTSLKSNNAEVSSANEANSSGQQEELSSVNDTCKEEERSPTSAKEAKQPSTEPEKENDVSEVPFAHDTESKQTEYEEVLLKLPSSPNTATADVPSAPHTNGSASEQPSAEAGEEGTAADIAEQTDTKNEIPKSATDVSNTAKHEPHGKGAVQDSAEEQTGKTKISKIPVRAGSKPRSSPPKTEKHEGAGN